MAQHELIHSVCLAHKSMIAEPAHLEPTLVKVLVPSVAIAAALMISRRRGLSWRGDLALRAASVAQTALWLALYIAWMLASDRLISWRGPWDFSGWARTPLPVAALRVLAVGVLGPIAEELIFRGFGYARLVRTRLGVFGTIVILAAVWAVIHVGAGYSAAVIAVIFVAGLLLGAARYRTGSVIVPMLMHIAWNLYAVW